MKFSTRQDTDIPADALFRAVGNFPLLERLMVRRGASVRRIGDMATPGAGMGWQIGFDWRGRQRDVQMMIADYTPPERILLQGSSDQFQLDIRMTVIALSPGKSRVIVETDVQPRGMKARLLLQTAKLGKSQLDRKYAQRIADFVTQAAAETVA